MYNVFTSSLKVCGNNDDGTQQAGVSSRLDWQNSEKTITFTEADFFQG